MYTEEAPREVTVNEMWISLSVTGSVPLKIKFMTLSVLGLGKYLSTVLVSYLGKHYSDTSFT